MIEKQKIFYAVDSPGWKSCLKLHLPEFSDSWFFEIDPLLNELSSGKGNIAVIEAGLDSIVSICKKVNLVSNSQHENRFFLVGGPELRNYLTLIHCSGFSGCCLSMGSIAQLKKLIRNHFRVRATNQLTIEERLAESLPWKPVRRKSFLENEN